MKTKAIKLLKMIVLVQIVLLCLFMNSDRRPQSFMPNHAQPEAGAGSVQAVLGSGNRLTAGMPDVLPAAESSDLSSIRTGRPEEASVLLIFNLFLVFSAFLFLLNGRLWSAIQSVSMDFQSYAMHQIRILQLWDGKKKGFFYS